jgi:dihydroxy-acid dehydratase
MQLRSNFEEGTTRWAVRRAQWIAMGIDEKDFEKPKIAVINSSSSLSVCYAHLDELSIQAQKAIREAGGLPFEVHTVAPSDFVTSAGLKARYLLPSRDLLVNDVEVMVEGACLDGMLMLASCDKTTPGQLMAAARLDIPAIVVPCGYQLGGMCGGREVDIEEVYKGVGTTATGAMSLELLTDWTRCAIKGPGVCAGLATANSMHCMAEALGMALTGSAPIRAGSEKLSENIKRAAKQILALVRDDVRPRSILTREAIENAVRVAIAIGASVNTVRHLCAIAGEAELNLDVIKLFEQNSDLPLLTQIRPNGPQRIEDLEHAGGVHAVMVRLKDKLHLGVRTVDHATLREGLAARVEIDAKVIRTLDNPFKKEPGLVILRGNMAPDGAIVKLSAVPESGRLFEGPARIFEDEDKAIHALEPDAPNKVKSGDIVILRMMGPRGGPGTVFACSFMAALVGAGHNDDVAVVTDGELSGLNRGITVGQVMPEAAEGGPLAVVQEGDRVRIDLHQRKLDILIPESELKARMSAWKKPVRARKRSWLSIYAQVVQPLSKGAILGDD